MGFEERPARYFGFVLFAGLFLRLVLAWNFYGTQDVDAWEQFSTYWQKSLSPYDESHRFNYSPIWFWIITLCSWISQKLLLPFSFVIKWPLILSDTAIFFVIYRSLNRLGQSQKTSFICAASFFLNPVSVLISGYHGQFDTISLLFMVLALYQASRFRDKIGWSTFFLSLGVAVKHFNVMIVGAFVFLQKSLPKRLFVLGAPPVLFLGLFIPYLESLPDIIRNVFQYNLGAGYWGWSGIICRGFLFFTGVDLIQASWFHWLSYFNPLLYAAMFAAAWRLSRLYELLDVVIFLFLIFYVFTTQIAPQYTLWIVPFAAMRRGKWFWVYSLIGSLQLLAFFYCHYHWFHKLEFQGRLGNLASETFVGLRYLTWLVCAAWLFHHSKHAKKNII